MKILFINNFFGPFGGAEKVMWDEAILLKEAGHTAHFFSTDRKPYFIPDYEYAKFFPVYMDFRNTSGIRKLLRFFHIVYNRQAEMALEKALRVIQPDVAHVHNLHYHLTPSVLAACQRQVVPVVMTLHDIRLICPSASRVDHPAFKGLCNTGNPMICLQKKCKNGRLSETLASVAEYYMNRHQILYKSIQKFITPSAALLELMVQAGFPREHFSHVNNFINRKLEKVGEPTADDQGYFLYVGRLSAEKGVQYLLQAMVCCPGVFLKVAGTGPQEEALKKLAQTLGLTDRVELLGFQDQTALANLLQQCRATVLPCNWFENLPLSVLESMAFGKPVIASAVGGLPEMLDHGRCGLLVQPTNIQQLTDAIRMLHDHPEIAYQLGNNGRIRVQSVYTEAHHITQLLSVYRQALNDSNCRTVLSRS